MILKTLEAVLKRKVAGNPNSFIRFSTEPNQFKVDPNPFRDIFNVHISNDYEKEFEHV